MSKRMPRPDDVLRLIFEEGMSVDEAWDAARPLPRKVAREPDLMMIIAEAFAQVEARAASSSRPARSGDSA